MPRAIPGEVSLYLEILRSNGVERVLEGRVVMTLPFLVRVAYRVIEEAVWPSHLCNNSKGMCTNCNEKVQA